MGESSNNSGMQSVWKLIWSLNYPHKIKHFMWRASLNILPTKHQLRRREIGWDGNCDLCGYCETTGHALWGCKLAGEVWGNTRLKLPFFEITPRDFIDVVWETKLKKPEIDWELFAITAWSLWSNRNSICHGMCKAADLIVREASAYVKEVRKMRSRANLCAQLCNIGLHREGGDTRSMLMGRCLKN